MTKTNEPLELLDELDEKLKLDALLELELLEKLKLLLEALLELLELLDEELEALPDAHGAGGHGSHWHDRGRHHQPPLTACSSSAISSRIVFLPHLPQRPKSGARGGIYHSPPRLSRRSETRNGTGRAHGRGQRACRARIATTRTSSTATAVAAAMTTAATFFCAAAVSSVASLA